MDFIWFIIDFIIHIDQHLLQIINQFGSWTYLILFAIIFVETGLVIFPFLPGDSLLFVASALAALDHSILTIGLLFVIFLAAAVIGDTVNYELGKKIGLSVTEHRVFGKFLDKEKVATAEVFFDKHGGKTIIIARFMPFIRTFAPFIAGASNMHYGQFIRYNFFGGFLWVSICCIAGYFFGNIPFIKEHFSLIVLAVIFISILPMIIAFIRSKLTKNTTKAS
ncbi:DedA family protein [Vagococcus xieshaowenii]|uniref:DedA family protein n=1 Tax=Vagococcus xieshaowenii TaxID=2562451 RepID=A0AAJ5EG26_9ENTE|nr:DedA family protein [Vagococcus xieshaowenii]TFZ42438.1 DedA family protein [Vagococcus xieshaowenii]